MDPLDAALEAIAKHPDRDDAYLVCADLLEERGDPRAKLMRVHLQALEDPTGTFADGRERREAELFEKYREELLGPLTPFEKVLARKTENAFEWHLGFIKKARFSFDFRDYASLPAHYDADRKFGNDVGVRALFGHPSGRFTRSLDIGASVHDRGEDYAPTVEALAEMKPRCLRELTIAAPAPVRADLTSMWPALRRLESLALHELTTTLGAPSLPYLRTLSLNDARTSVAWTEWTLPRLHELQIMDDPGVTVADLRHFLNRHRAVHVLRLSLGPLDDLLDMLCENPAQLTHLYLFGHCTEESARLLQDHAKDLAHLTHFNIITGFPPPGFRGLHRVIPNFRVNGKKPQ